MNPTSPTVSRNFGTSSDHTMSRSDWIRSSVIAGFLATFVMTVCIAIAYGMANALGDANGASWERWLYALSNNKLTEHIGTSFFAAMIGNLIMGIVWAVLYARYAEPALRGPAWFRGAVFAILPFLLTVVIAFPSAGVGFFANQVHGGPLPVGGALVLHLIYGVVLGTVYGLDGNQGLRGARGEGEAAAGAERGAAIGIGIGAVLGFIGGWFLGPQLASLASQPVVGIAGALSGAAMGILIGSLLGMNLNDEADSNR